MADVYVPYVIRNGEYLAQLAFRRGFECDKVWNHAKNKAVRELRKGKSNLLCAGDVIFIPKSAAPDPLPLSVGEVNNYTAIVPTSKFDLHFNGSNGPLANARYTYTVEGVEAQGTTDGNGKASFTVPISCTDVHVVFPDQHLSVVAKVGHLDPIEEDSGVRQRLKNRGYIRGAPTDDEQADADKLAQAIAAFQKDQGLPVTSAMDDATRAKLREMCGS